MDRKADILDSAERLVRRRGYDAFSYADIEKEVGIRKASIHHHYARKADLALAVIERYAGRFDASLDSIAERERSAAAQLMGYLDAYRSALSGGDMLCLCVALSASRDSLSEPVLKELNAFHDASIKWLEQVFARALDDGSLADVGDPRTEATGCLALVEGAMLLARVAQNTMRFEAAVAGVRARVRD